MSDKPKSKSKPKASKASSKKIETKASIKSKKDEKSPKSTKKSLKSQKSKKSLTNKSKEENTEINDNKTETKSNLSTNLLNTEHNMNNNMINNNTIEKCEGCFQGEGAVYCSNCGKVYCKICDDQLHIIPAYRTHERTPLSMLSSMNANCYHHNIPLRYYCESCDEPVCNLCQQQGPHNTSLHRVTSLFEVYRRRLSGVKERIEKELVSKQAKIESVMLNIDSMIKTTKENASNILRGINNEYDISEDTLNKCEGKKLAMLNYNAASIQKEIIAIEDILSFINTEYIDTNGNARTQMASMNSNRSSNDEKDYLSFLLKHKAISEKVDTMVASSCPTFTRKEIDDMMTWPVELNDAKHKLENYEKIKTLMKIKDDIVWNLLTTPYEEKASELDEIRNKKQNEIAEWSKLSDKYANELKKYNLVCAYCGCYLDNIKINENCSCNSSKTFTNKKYTTELPEDKVNGTGRHWFSAPTEEYENKMKNKSIDTGSKMKMFTNTINPFEHNMLNEINKTGINFRYQNEEMTNEWVISVASYVEREKINLYQVLCDYDLDGDGFITIAELLASFKKIGIMLKDNENRSMIQYLQAGDTNNRVDIKNFAKHFVRKKSKVNDNIFEQ